MKLEVDEFAHLESPIHRWEPRSKLIGLFILIFAFAFVEELQLLPAMLGVTAVLYAASRLPFSFLLRRLRYPGFFLLGVVLLLPFFSGSTVIWQWGPIALRQEGLSAALLVVCRFLAILITGFVLLNTTPFLQLIKAMRSLGLPAIFADMTLLAYRYLYDVAATLSKMQQAMRLRGFRSQRQTNSSASRKSLLPGLRDFKLLSSLAGTLFVRSYEQSERVYKAMRLRGYGNSFQMRAAVETQSPDLAYDTWSAIALALTLLVAISFVAAELYFEFS